MLYPMNDCFLKTAKGAVLDRTPIWMMRQAGRYLPEYRQLRKQVTDFIEFCHTPELCCEATLQPLRRFDLDAAIIFNDILTLPNTMGAPLTFVPGTGPCFSQPIRSLKDVKALQDVDVDDMGYVMKAISMTRSQLSIPLIGFAGSPWTVASYLVEGSGSKVWSTIRAMLYQQPEILHALLARLARNTAVYLNGQIAAGADAIMLFDSWGGVLAQDQYSLFSLQYIEQIIEQLNVGSGEDRVPVIVFVKHGLPWMKQIAACGCDVVAVDGSVNLQSIAAQLGGARCIQGNLDPFSLYGDVSTIEKLVQQIMTACQGVPHIMNLGHGIDKNTPIVGVEAMIAAVRKFECAANSNQ